LGDVSSQIYEFLETRRPTIFLNSHDADWAGNPFYTNWTTGPVLSTTDSLIDMVRQAKETHAEYLPAQNAAFNDTFEFSGGKSSVKAANAIADFVKQEMYSEVQLEAAQ
jgi:CDP-glycerol glycerophosphotransferase (TagB/SpsB family)